LTRSTSVLTYPEAGYSNSNIEPPGCIAAKCNSFTAMQPGFYTLKHIYGTANGRGKTEKKSKD
jgi:hypothetical protein